MWESRREKLPRGAAFAVIFANGSPFAPDRCGPQRRQCSSRRRASCRRRFSASMNPLILTECRLEQVISGGSRSKMLTISKRTCSQGVSSSVHTRATRQMPPLLRIDRLFRWTEFVRGPSLHFHDHQVLALARDQIRLCVSGSKAVVPRHDGVSLLAQKPMCQIFPAAACSLVWIPDPAPACVPHSIQCRPDHALITCSRHSITLPRTTKHK